MNEQPLNQEPKLPAEQNHTPVYAYRWSYEAQAAYDRKELKKRRGRGAGVYAIVMSVAFLLCLAVLGGVLLINRLFDTPDVKLSTEEVAELINPSTVLIYASGTDQYGFGTGFFVRSDGYLLTNFHVVENSEEISVTLYSGQELKATLQWASVADDLALLKVSGSNYPVPAIGNSSMLQVGETAIAIGHPAGNVCPWSVTQGIISAVNREVTVEKVAVNGGTAIVDLYMLQTDAQVNPGNSGGPLCNDRGEVIGIVTRKMSEYEGIGLAIPINGAMELVNAFLTTGSTKNVQSSISKIRPTIGIQAAAIKKGEQITSDYSAPQDGILVVSVNEGSAADGVLEAGDVILSFDGEAVHDMDAFRQKLYQYRGGDKVQLIVDRFGERLTLDLTLGVASK